MLKSKSYHDESAIRYRQFTDQIINEVSAILCSVQTLENRFSLISVAITKTMETLSEHSQDLPALIARRELKGFLTALEALKEQVRLNLRVVIHSARASIRVTLDQLTDVSASNSIVVELHRHSTLMECIAVLNRLDKELLNADVSNATPS
ncbi:hypothetical protein SAMN05216593_104107 [Pseudomonas asturiensis]|uniref:Uncharacterized protein n=1 Tax=Pseudomonas asturiensis TaxID=1190415 RepID=A0A1M7MC72_9PSED|nr:hypothetical protein [Pseudomonas asturiensis]SHM88381.1 hypothetical protein SAMN05216593_104107 [Pseudomonas asturiensis]